MVSLLQQLVTGQAERRPEQTAIVYRQERLSYGELEETSNRLAHLLKEAGCKRGDRVGFLIPKTPAAIGAILGILKADCVYVPLDTSSPAPRLEKIIDACAPRFVVAGGAVTPLLDELMADKSRRDGTAVGWMGEGRIEGNNFRARFSREDLGSYSSEPLDYKNTVNDAAHILFTSGSTGVPKGVIITHSNVIHFITWAVKHFGAKPSDRISSHPPLHFDLSTFDVYGTLGSGAQLHIVPTELNLLPQKLAEFIRDSELTQWFSAPSVLNFMAKADVVKQDDFPALERLLWCGEVFPTSPLIYWMRRLPRVKFTNLYGPTEATIASSYYTVPQCPDDERAEIPIGAPCDGEGLLALDDELKPVPAGAIGDLYISGVGLSPGYWQDPEKTDAVFIKRPGSSDPNDRIYKTGDLAPPARLRTEMSKVLPNYMMPARWMRFDFLPKNANGKIDRRALRERFQKDGA
jgi:amino acid adenylation domain-containing protein